MFIQNIIMDIICLLCFVKRIGECPNGENNLRFGFVNKSYISYFFIIWLIVINRFIHFWHRKWFHHHRVVCFCLAQGTGTAPDRRRRSRGVPLCRAFRRLPTARCTETRRRPGLGEDVLRFWKKNVKFFPKKNWRRKFLWKNPQPKNDTPKQRKLTSILRFRNPIHGFKHVDYVDSWGVIESMSQQTFFGIFHFVSSFRSILYKHCGLWNVEIAAFKPQRSLAITTAIAHLAFVAMACSNCDMQRYAKICRIQLQTAPNWHRQRRNAWWIEDICIAGARLIVLPGPSEDGSWAQGASKSLNLSSFLKSST